MLVNPILAIAAVVKTDQHQSHVGWDETRSAAIIGCTARERALGAGHVAGGVVPVNNSTAVRKGCVLRRT